MIDLTYSLIIEATAEPDYFGFYSPELEGFTGIGHSVEDCLYKAKWGMREHVALLQEQGLPVPPENEDPKITIRNERKSKKRSLSTSQFRSFVDMELSELKAFAEEQEIWFRGKINYIDKLIKDKVDSLQEHDLESYHEEQHFQSNIFPRIFRYSLFIMLYTFLESQLLNICNFIEKKFDYQIKVNDLSGKGIFRAHKFLQKVVGIKIPEDSEYWKNIIIYNRIRNFIAHNNGYIDNKQYEKIKEYIKNNSNKIIIDYNRITLYESFITDVIKNLEEFFDVFFKLWSSLIRERN